MMMDMENVSLRDDVNGEEKEMRSERQRAKFKCGGKGFGRRDYGLLRSEINPL